MNKKLLRNAFAGLTAVGGLGAVAAGYIFAVRPWHLRWGATDEELTEKLPGDDVKPDAGIQVTHAVTIDAPPETVWKWLVQIGQDRGGFYSYDWLENVFDLQIHNTDAIKTEWQQLKIGDFVRGAHKGWLGGRFDDKAGWHVVRLDENRALVLRDTVQQGSWSFILKPFGENKTRLLIRARGDKPESAGAKIFQYGLMEPAHFIMERKMLLTLKEKAERRMTETTAPEKGKTMTAASI
jgi:hypothetical protein